MESKNAQQTHRNSKKIVQKMGWPDINKVGEDGVKAAWLIVQHADEDIDFQKYCLSLMKKSDKKGKELQEDLAYLIDRVAKNTGKKQTYGTQFYRDARGKYKPWPIRAIKNPDTRRKKVGLQCFQEYENYMKERSSRELRKKCILLK